MWYAVVENITHNFMIYIGPIYPICFVSAVMVHSPKAKKFEKLKSLGQRGFLSLHWGTMSIALFVSSFSKKLAKLFQIIEKILLGKINLQ